MTTKDEPKFPSTDWHDFREPPEEITNREGETVKNEDRDASACETCGLPGDALVHASPEERELHEAKMKVEAAEEKERRTSPPAAKSSSTSSTSAKK